MFICHDVIVLNLFYFLGGGASALPRPFVVSFQINCMLLIVVYVFKKVVRMSCAIVPVLIKINILRQ